MKAMEAPIRETTVDGSRVDSEGGELPTRDDTMLSAGERGNESAEDAHGAQAAR